MEPKTLSGSGMFSPLGTPSDKGFCHLDGCKVSLKATLGKWFITRATSTLIVLPQYMVAVAAGCRKPCSVLDGPFFCFLAQTGVENASFTLWGLLFWHFSLQECSDRRTLTIERSLMSGDGQCHELAKKKLCPELTPSRIQNTGQRRCDYSKQDL